MLVRDGRIAAAGAYADVARQAGAGVATVDHRPHLHPAGLHRRACAFPADADHRLLRRRAARLAEQIHVSRRDEVLQPAARPPHRAAVPRRDGAAGHDDRRRLLLGAQGIGRSLLRRGGRAQHAGHRRQGDDGPQRAGRPSRHAAIRLRRYQGADQRPGTARAGRSMRSRRASPSPRRRSRWRWPARCCAEHPDCHMQTHLSENHAEIAFTQELYPWSRDYTDVYEHYGLLGTKEPVRPLHPSVRTRGRCAVGDGFGRGVLPDLEPVPRLRPVRLPALPRRGRSRCGSPPQPMSAAAPTIRCCGPWTRATR